MLILSRKVGGENGRDRIVVGDGETAVVFVVLEVRGANIRVGVDAAETVRIRRGELPEGQR